MLELVKGPSHHEIGGLFDLLYSIATQRTQKVLCYEEYAIAVRLSTAIGWPRPNEQLLKVPQEAKRHVWLSNVNGVLGSVTARGATVRECKRRVYRTINNVVIHRDVQYRGDIGDDVEGDKSKLEEWGWLQQ